MTQARRTRLGFDLLMEVEALRETIRSGPSPEQYKRVYTETAYLTHNAAGPEGGYSKLLARYYPEEQGEADWNGQRLWRETLMMRRLGMSPEEIEAWKDEAREAECFT